MKEFEAELEQLEKDRKEELRVEILKAKAEKQEAKRDANEIETRAVKSGRFAGVTIYPDKVNRRWYKQLANATETGVISPTLQRRIADRHRALTRRWEGNALVEINDAFTDISRSIIKELRALAARKGQG